MFDSNDLAADGCNDPVDSSPDQNKYSEPSFRLLVNVLVSSTKAFSAEFLPQNSQGAYNSITRRNR